MRSTPRTITSLFPRQFVLTPTLLSMRVVYFLPLNLLETVFPVEQLINKLFFSKCEFKVPVLVYPLD